MTYTLNRTPTDRADGITPYHALTGVKPNTRHLRPYGCVTAFRDPKSGSFTDRRRIGRCVGYGDTDGCYVIRAADTNRTSHTEDVVFDEMSSVWAAQPDERKASRAAFLKCARLRHADLACLRIPSDESIALPTQRPAPAPARRPTSAPTAAKSGRLKPDYTRSEVA